MRVWYHLDRILKLETNIVSKLEFISVKIRNLRVRKFRNVGEKGISGIMGAETVSILHSSK